MTPNCYLTILLMIPLLKIIDCELKETTSSAFLEECVTAHNKYRKLHGSEKLTEEPKVTNYAMVRLRKMLNSGQVTRDYLQRLTDVYGESLYWFHDTNGHHSCADVVKLWYEGNKFYDYNRPGFSRKSGGFTQIVWRGTKQLGCARVTGQTRNIYETYIVCNYYPAGNVDRQYPYNVYPAQEKEEPVLVPEPGSGPLLPRPPQVAEPSSGSSLLPRPPLASDPISGSNLVPNKSSGIYDNNALVINHPPTRVSG